MNVYFGNKKINKAVIVDETKFYSQMTPAERKSIEARYMKDAKRRICK